MNYSAAIFLVFMSISVYSQVEDLQKKIDSVNLVLKNNPVDSTQASALIELSELLQYENNDTARPLNLQAIRIIDKTLKKNPDGKSQKHLKTLKAKALHNVAYTYFNGGDNDSARSWWNKTMKLAVANQDSARIAYTYYCFGYLENYIGNVEQSIKDYNKALIISDKSKTTDVYIETLIALGMSYSNRKNTEKTIYYYKKAAEESKKAGDEKLLANALSNLGATYRDLGESEKALDYLNEALEIHRKLNFKLGEAYTLLSIGKVNLASGKPDLAQSTAQEALGIFRKIKNVEGEIYALFRLSEIASSGKDYPMLFQYADQGLKLAKQVDDKYSKRDFYEFLGNAYLQSGNYKSAFESMEIYHELNDSLNNSSLKELQLQKDLEYQFEKRSDSIQYQKLLAENSLEKQMHNNRLLITYGIIGLLILAGGVGFLFYRNKQKEKQSKAELEKRMSEAAMSSLHAQMNPHFIFNCLGSIKHMIIANEHENANTYLNRFSKLIRDSLNNSRKSTVFLSEEVAYLNNYLQMESLRFENSFDYSIKIADSLDEDETAIPSMMIQPLVENAIWHGLLNIENNRHLTIEFFRENDKLVCKIEDNGIGINQSKSKPMSSDHKSIGLENIKERLSILNVKNQTDCELKITDRNDLNKFQTGTIVILELPLMDE